MKWFLKYLRIEVWVKIFGLWSCKFMNMEKYLESVLYIGYENIKIVF